MTINRRKFLGAAGAFALPITLNGLGLNALTEQSAMVRTLRQSNAAFSDRILVIINMSGGNDGLNAVIPLDQYGAYVGLRSNIAIPQSSVLPLTGTQATGFHPAMAGLRDLYNEGKLSIIHSVSYPNASQSHFRSNEIWVTGVDANQYTNTGWMGRTLENRYPGYPIGYPNDSMEDPIALQIGYISNTSLQGALQSMAITIDSPDNFYQLIGAPQAAPPQNLPPNAIGEQIQYVRLQQALAVGYATEIKNAADAGQNLATYPTDGENRLADQLKIVARLIHGGLKTKVFFVDQDGYDTHSGQVDTTDVRQGNHAQLLGELSQAITIFQRDLELMGKADRVLGMTYSEFGRRATSNNSRGTDHGVAAPMFVFGAELKKSQIGLNPDLTNGLLPAVPEPWETQRDIKMQIDFRRIYADILTDWFGTAQSVTDQILFRNFPTTSLFRDGVETVEDGSWNDQCVWSAGRPPKAGEKVQIKSGHTVNVSQNVSSGPIVNGGTINLFNGSSIITG